MDIRQAIRIILLADPAVVALVEDRVFGGKLQQKVIEPSVVYRLHDCRDVPILNSPGVSMLTYSELRFGCVARGDEHEAYDISVSIDAAVRRRIQGFHGTVTDGASPENTIDILNAWRIGAEDFYDDPTQTYWTRTDWIFAHQLT